MSKTAAERQYEVEAFLYAEARLLERNRFDDWLELLTDDIRYWMPVREDVEVSEDGSGISDTFALYDDDKRSLDLRAMRIKTGLAHAEVPPSVTQRMVTNVVVSPTDKPDEIHVQSSYMVFQARRGRHDTTFYGRREDVLRYVDGSLKIASRKIDPAQSILPMTISIFF